jgi:hypothetical protein
MHMFLNWWRRWLSQLHGVVSSCHRRVAYHTSLSVASAVCIFVTWHSTGAFPFTKIGWIHGHTMIRKGDTLVWTPFASYARSGNVFFLCTRRASPLFSDNGLDNCSLQCWTFLIYGCIWAVFFVCYSYKTYQVESVCFSLCTIPIRHSFRRGVLESFQGADNRLHKSKSVKFRVHTYRVIISDIASLKFHCFAQSLPGRPILIQRIMYRRMTSFILQLLYLRGSGSWCMSSIDWFLCREPKPVVQYFCHCWLRSIGWFCNYS